MAAASGRNWKYFRTTHFWGPVANWLFVLAGTVETQKPASLISPQMTGVMCVYSALFMRFATQVQPKNMLLFSCHLCNETVQLYNLTRWGYWRMNASESELKALNDAKMAGLALEKPASAETASISTTTTDSAAIPSTPPPSSSSSVLPKNDKK